MTVRSSRYVVAVALCSAILSVLSSLILFSGNPGNVDGFAQLFQARIFLAGRLWAPPPPDVANFATLQMVIGPERWYSQYPPGQSIVLALGLALGGWWLLNPLLTAALTAVTYRVARWCADESTARLTIALLCVSPFVLAVVGSEMSHLGAAAFGLSAAAAATLLGGRRETLAAAGAGAALGLMVAFRPLDAVAAAAPVAAITGLAASRPWRALGVTVLAGALLVAPTLWYNAATTGSWHVFGYTALWGPGVSLGFHAVPFGIPLTPARAVGLASIDLHQLNTHLFDLPFPILALIGGAFAASRRSVTTRDAVAVLGVLALSGVFFFYWHRDVYYGPRFLFSAAPWYLVLIARAAVLLRRVARTGSILVFALLVSLAVGWLATTPGRLWAYRNSTPGLGLHPDREARRAGISRAVVVIPDGWGSRLIARMWALGVPVRESNRLYAAIDACTLERALDEAESASQPAAKLVGTLESLATMARPGVPLSLTEDLNMRLVLGDTLAPACTAEQALDGSGFLAFAPFLYLNNASLDGDIVWARDLGQRNAKLFARYPGRRLYRYAPATPGGRPQFVPAPGGLR